MKPVISIIMGSKSDWGTMKKTSDLLDQFGVPYEKKVVSAHRTPENIYMKPVISIIMGSKSDWGTMKKTSDLLDQFGVPYEKKVVSAHRTPDLMFQHAEEARARGIKVIIAGAGGAAHLPGMVAAKTTLPVIGVPVQSRALSGLDSL